MEQKEKLLKQIVEAVGGKLAVYSGRFPIRRRRGSRLTLC